MRFGPPGPPPYYAPAPQPPQAAPPRRSSAGPIVALIVAIAFVLTCLTVGGFLAYQRFFGGLRKTLLAAQDLAPDDVKEQTLDYQGKVTVPRGLLARTTRLELSAISGAPKADDMASVHDVYDVVLGDLHQFDDYVQLELPINPATLSSRSSGKTRHILMAFNAAAGAWSPIVYRRTLGRPSLTVFTDHLSGFGGVDGVVLELSPTMKLPYGTSKGSSSQRTARVSRSTSWRTERISRRPSAAGPAARAHRCTNLSASTESRCKRRSHRGTEASFEPSDSARASTSLEWRRGGSRLPVR